MKVAKKFLDEGKKLNFAVANKDNFRGVLSEFGLEPNSDAPVVALRTAKGDKYAMSETFRLVRSSRGALFQRVTERTAVELVVSWTLRTFLGNLPAFLAEQAEQVPPLNLTHPLKTSQFVLNLPAGCVDVGLKPELASDLI